MFPFRCDLPSMKQNFGWRRIQGISVECKYLVITLKCEEEEKNKNKNYHKLYS